MKSVNVFWVRCCVRLVVLAAFSSSGLMGQYPGTKVLIAHRGASAYAPEHTEAAYRLALEQGADYVEQDLQITRDGVLVCMHDETLERTTNVEEVFPTRCREVAVSGEKRKRWYVSDFSLAEIKSLDAGSWLGPRFAGQRVPTFREAIEIVDGRAGLFPETKSPESYVELGFAMERLLREDLAAFGLDGEPNKDRPPVIVQSFSRSSLERVRKELNTRIPLVFLISEQGAKEWLNLEGLGRIRAFADGIGPAKNLLKDNPQLVSIAHQVGLSVTPYTFRSSGLPTFYPNVREEMAFFLFQLGVDALFTDNPDQFPREPLR